MAAREIMSRAQSGGKTRLGAAARSAAAEAQKTAAIVRAVSEQIADRLVPFVPAYMNQAMAANYLGVSARYFREFVEVTPVPFPGSGDKPVDRYARVDLDAWAERQRDPKTRRRAS